MGGLVSTLGVRQLPKMLRFELLLCLLLTLLV
jgi:hypothetical protein